MAVVTHGETIPATAAHLAAMQRRVDVSLSPAMLTHAWTFLVEGQPLCCFGITTLWPGVGHAWFLERDAALHAPYARQIGRAVLRAWRHVRREFRYVEALVVMEREDSRRLIECLGFEPVVFI